MIISLADLPEESMISRRKMEEQKRQVSENTSERKPRWKKTDRPVAKKTRKKQQAKKKAGRK